jgi:hypothetical protein
MAFVSGSFLASPELRVFAANTVFSTDIKDGEVKTPDLANNAVTAAKIKDGEVKAAEIATDAVGAAELQGVTKLLFGECTITSNTQKESGGVIDSFCAISGVDSDDRAIAIKNSVGPGTADRCFDITQAQPVPGKVALVIVNQCDSPSILGTAKIGVMVYDK